MNRKPNKNVPDSTKRSIPLFGAGLAEKLQNAASTSPKFRTSFQELMDQFDSFDMEDDSDEDDDDTSEDSDDDDGVDCDLIVSQLKSMFSGVVPVRKNTPPVKRPIVPMTRDTVTSVAKNLPSTASITPVVAKPGSGKTTDLPEQSSSLEKLVVVPDNVVLASVVVAKRVSWVDKDRKIHGDDKPVYYVTNEVLRSLLQSSLFPSYKVQLFFDEMQRFSLDTAFSFALSDIFGHTNPVVQLYGNTSDRGQLTLRQPTNVTVKDLRAYDSSKHDRIMYIHSEHKTMETYKEVKGQLVIDAEDVVSCVEVMESCKSLDRYVLHIHAENVVGVHIERIQAVVAPSRYISRGQVHTVDRDLHIQFMARINRTSNEKGTYYVENARIPESLYHKSFTEEDIRTNFAPEVDVFLDKLHMQKPQKRDLSFRKFVKPINGGPRKKKKTQLEATYAEANRTRAMAGLKPLSLEREAFEQVFPVEKPQAEPTTTIDFGDRPCTIQELAGKPMINHTYMSDEYYYPVERLSTGSPKHVVEYVKTNYNYIVASARKHVDRAMKGEIRRAYGPPTFYSFYLQWRERYDRQPMIVFDTFKYWYKEQFVEGVPNYLLFGATGGTDFGYDQVSYLQTGDRRFITNK